MLSEPRVENLNQRRVRRPPDRHCRFEAARATFGEPHRPLSLIALDSGDFDQTFALQGVQVSGEGGRIKSQPLGQAAQRIVGGRGDLSHQAKLGGAQPSPRHLSIQELRDEPRRETAVQASARVNQGGGVAPQRL